MVRFIIIIMNAITLRDLKIYIPIWLDLLYVSGVKLDAFGKRFTFQYG